MSADQPRPASGSGAVALGIFASRIAGLVRETVASRLLGNTPAADAFVVAMKIPNLLQNLLGEGVLSASLVPVYSRLLGERDGETSGEAGRVAGAVAASLMAVTGAGVLVFMALARPITLVLAPGLSDDRFELAVSLTRVTALGVGFTVLSAWCLGVLNSHRRFFLSYVAPVVWNGAQVGALVVASVLAFDLEGVARAMAWGVMIGGLAQLLVQLPLTLRLAKGLRLGLRWRHRWVREVRRRFGPAVLGRGVVQVSAYLDVVLASLLAGGALAALSRAQILYTLPVSLFAMSVAAAELPEMSRLADDPAALAPRTQLGVRRVVFWMALVCVVYITAGDLMVEILFEGREFTSADTVVVWFTVGAYALGLPATGASRILQSTSYALGDTKGPARIAVARVAVAGAVGVMVMFPLDRVIVGPDGLVGLTDALGLAWALPDLERSVIGTVRLGAVGLAAGSAVAAWVELILLARLLLRSPAGSGRVGSAMIRLAKPFSSAFVAAAALKLGAGSWPLPVSALAVVGTAASVYTVVAFLSGVREADLLLKPIRRALWR